MARPKKKIDPEQVKKLALIQCTMIEMAAFFECSVDTLERRFADVIKIGRENGKTSLKRKQFEIAMSGNVGMLIWLGKQHLGQKDQVENEMQVNADVTYTTSWGGNINVAPTSQIVSVFGEVKQNK